MLPKQEIEDEKKEGDGEKPENGLGDEVRLGANGRLDSGSSEFFLQVRIIIEENGGPELCRLLDPGRLLPVIADQGLSRLSFLNDKSKRKVLVINDLLIIEQLDEPVVGNILDIGIAAVPDEQGHADQGKGDRDQDDTAPIKVRLITALVIARRVSVGLCH